MIHTPENWDKEPCEAARHGGFYLVDSDGSGIGHIYAKFGAGEHNASRIVACVNACHGISTKTLEYANAHREKLNGINTAYKIAAGERDTYRELCGDLINEIKTAVVYSENNIGAIDHLKAAITRAEAILGEKK